METLQSLYNLSLSISFAVVVLAFYEWLRQNISKLAASYDVDVGINILTSHT